MPDLTSIIAATSATKVKGLPPVHLWNPPFCGDIGMRIAADGTWFYQGTPILRPAMVRLFASILRKDEGRHVLVTPVEMVLVQVDDAPFLAVEVDIRTAKQGLELAFRTNLDDWTTADAEHPLRFELEPTGGLKPYVLVRGGLWAKVTRSIALELMNMAEARLTDGIQMLGIVSAGSFFPMLPLDELT